MLTGGGRPCVVPIWLWAGFVVLILAKQARDLGVFKSTSQHRGVWPGLSRRLPAGRGGYTAGLCEGRLRARSAADTPTRHRAAPPRQQ